MTRFTLKTIFSILALVGLLATRVLAIEPVPYTVGLSFSTQVTGAMSATMTVYSLNGSPVVTATSSSAAVESAIGLSSLQPDAHYSVNMAGSGSGSYSMSFTAPDGYAVYINNLPADMYQVTGVSGAFNTTYDLEVRSTSTATGGTIGQFSGIAMGQSVSWSVGLGNLRTGRSAGAIEFRQNNLSSTVYTRDFLNYVAPANTGQISVIYDGPSNQRLKQIGSPAGFVDIVDITNGYQFNFYTYGQTSWSGSVYTFTGVPWKSISITNPSAGVLKAVDAEGTNIHVSTVTETGRTAATLPASGGTITTSGPYTIHTFTATSASPFNVTSAISSADYLVVGGGGGGGSWNCGGGGGGGDVEYFKGVTFAVNSYALTVAGSVAADTQGQNSTFNGITAYGGGYGSNFLNGHYYASAGGSGGGGTTNLIGAAAGSGSHVNQGGGGDNGGSAWQGGGGGGGGANTQNPAQGGGTYGGGPGFISNISGTVQAYGGGGAGGTTASTSCLGGVGGGGNGANNSTAYGYPGAANTGGGGGGAYSSTAGTGGAGGSGVVIIRYLTPATANTYVWTLQEGDNTGLGGAPGNIQRTTIHTSSVPTSGQRDDLVTVQTGASGPVVAKTKYHSVTQDWGEELDTIYAYSSATDTDATARKTAFTYNTSSAYPGNYRKVQSITSPSGNWVARDYYDSWNMRGQLYHEYYPFETAPTTAQLNQAQGRVITYAYTYDWTGRYRELNTRMVAVNNLTTEKMQRNLNYDSTRYRYDQNNYSDAINFQMTHPEFLRWDSAPDMANQLMQQQNPDVSMDSRGVSLGDYNGSTKVFTVNGAGNCFREVVLHGSTTWAPIQVSPTSTVTGEARTSDFLGVTVDSIYLFPTKSTADVIIRLSYGTIVRTETYIYCGGGTWYLLKSTDYNIDFAGRQTGSTDSNGAVTGVTITNGQVTSSIGIDGTEIQYTYDSIGRVATSTKKTAPAVGSYALQLDITTGFTYDGAGNVTGTVCGSLSTSAEFNLDGRPKTSTAPGGYVTLYAYPDPLTVTVSLPGTDTEGGVRTTKTTTVFLDGSPHSVTGSAVVNQFVSRSVNNTTGNITTTTRNGTLSSSNQVQTTTDWLGQTITVNTPAWTSGTWSNNWVTQTNTYDQYGHVVKVASPGMANKYYNYDSLGALWQEYLDYNKNDLLELAGNDRVKQYFSYYNNSGSAWYFQKDAYAYAALSSATATLVDRTNWQLSNLASGYLSSIRHIDVFGNLTVTAQTVNRSGKTVTNYQSAVGSSVTGYTVLYNGLAVEVMDTHGHDTFMGFDSLGRLSTVKDPRTGHTTLTTYKAGTSLPEKFYDEQANFLLPGTDSPTSYTQYDSCGRVASVTDALGKKAYTTYTDRGEVWRSWGDTVSPVSYTYDYWGHKATLSTYRTDSVGLWTASTWPTIPGSADTTTWNYHEASGLLNSKMDATTTHGVSFTYTAFNQPYVRTLARGLTTTNTYDSATGEKTDVDYTGGTPSVHFTYNRLGDVATVKDATDETTGRTFNYNLTGTLELTNEVLPSSFYGNLRITRGYTTTSGAAGMYNLLSIGTSSNPASVDSLHYGYDSVGRMNLAESFTYTYVPNSDLISGVTSSGWTPFNLAMTYDGYHDWLHTRTTSYASTTYADLTYTRDALGRATKIKKVGSVFNCYGDTVQGLDANYGYNDRSEVNSDTTTLGGTTTPLPGRQDAYAYDPIGNRATVTHNGTSISYKDGSGNTANNLNQYVQRATPGVFDIAGDTDPAKTVTVTPTAGTFTHGGTYGPYFFNPYPVTNTNGFYSTLTVTDGTDSATLPAWVAPTTEAFVYDLDGNLTSDGLWDYTYDAENRLQSMQTHTALIASSVVPAAKAVRLEFTYDYMGRRVEKFVKSYNGSAYTTVVTDLKFVYDGWNLILELNNLSSLALVREHVWGLDLSGSLQGAGGVGGLLYSYDAATSHNYLPAYDGGGNILALIAPYSSSAQATYEYDAFGKVLRSTGSLANAGTLAASYPFGYSTKYTDLETSLVYYGHRFYSPSLGRFINKDPIEEQGGLNLYGFCGNNGINKWDYLGMDDPVWNWSGTPDPSWTYYGGGYIDPATNTYYNFGPPPPRDTSEDGGDFTDGNGHPMGGGMFGGIFPDSVYANQDVTAYMHEQNTTFGAMDALNRQVINNITLNLAIANGTVGKLTTDADGYLTGRGTPTVRYGDMQVLPDDSPTQLAPYQTSPKSQTSESPESIAAGYDNSRSHTPNSYDLYRSLDFRGLDGAPGAMVRGGAVITAGVAGGFAVEAATPLLVAAGKDLRIDGPQRGGRLLQLRYGNMPLIRLDYGRYPGSGGEPRLHLNIGPGKDNLHVPLDPRTWFGR